MWRFHDRINFDNALFGGVFLSEFSKKFITISFKYPSGIIYFHEDQPAKSDNFLAPINHKNIEKMGEKLSKKWFEFSERVS